LSKAKAISKSFLSNPHITIFFVKVFLSPSRAFFFSSLFNFAIAKSIQTFLKDAILRLRLSFLSFLRYCIIFVVSPMQFILFTILAFYLRHLPLVSTNVLSELHFTPLEAISFK